MLTIADLKGRKTVNAAHLRVTGGGAWLYGVEDVPRLQFYDFTSSRTGKLERSIMVDGITVPDLQAALDVINGVKQLAEVLPPAPLLANTIYQPWASLIMVGAKPYEFRHASYLDHRAYHGLRPSPGDRIVIHAAARPVKPAEVEDLLKRLGTDADTTGLIADKARELLERVRAAFKYRLLPIGCGLGTALLGKPRNAGAIFAGLRHDSDRGDFNWAWPMSDPRPFDAPVPMRGQQGFWKWPDTA